MSTALIAPIIFAPAVRAPGRGTCGFKSPVALCNASGDLIVPARRTYACRRVTYNAAPSAELNRGHPCLEQVAGYLLYRRKLPQLGVVHRTPLHYHRTARVEVATAGWVQWGRNFA